MLENENLVAGATEKAEIVTAEQNDVEQVIEKPAEKTYTQSELDDIVGKRLARNTAKIRKEYDRQYGNLTEVLKAGTGKESVEEITDTFSKFYESKGIKIAKTPNYTDSDIKILAQAEANEVIDSGYDEVVYEVDRLAKLGAENMTARDKVYFKALAEHRQKTERQQELSKIGVADDVYNSKDFQDFVGQFKAETPIANIYEIYNKTKEKKEFKTAGSMKNNIANEGTVKDYYSFEEASKFTKEDFDKNPELFKAVKASMVKWK